MLRESAAWEGIVDAWRARGAVLAGSSAGAMAFGEWTLLRQRMPGRRATTALAGLGLVPRVAVIPHYDAFGEDWLDSARAALPTTPILLGIPERTAALWTADDGWRSVGPGAVTVHGADGTLAGLADPSPS